MNCNTIRKYFYAFTDNELDVDRNIEILEHLDMCYECGKKMEKERSLHRRVRETVFMVKAPDYLERHILERVEETAGFFALLKKSFFIKNRLVPISVFAATVILTVCFFVIPSNVKKNSIPYFAELTYHNFLMQQPDLDIRSQDIETVEKYLQRQTKARVLLPKMREGVSLIGASLFDFDGVMVSQVYYTYDKNPISVMIICNAGFVSEQRKSIDFSGMEEVPRGEFDVYYKSSGYCGNCQIIGWKKAENQYVMVSMLQGNEMERMLTRA